MIEFELRIIINVTSHHRTPSPTLLPLLPDSSRSHPLLTSCTASKILADYPPPCFPVWALMPAEYRHLSLFTTTDLEHPHPHGSGSPIPRFCVRRCCETRSTHHHFQQPRVPVNLRRHFTVYLMVGITEVGEYYTRIIVDCQSILPQIDTGSSTISFRVAKCYKCQPVDQRYNPQQPLVDYMG